MKKKKIEIEKIIKKKSWLKYQKNENFDFVFSMRERVFFFSFLEAVRFRFF